MKRCELCKSAARTYCESDQANLCWNCDAKVHGANFLVARHARAVLCQSCQFPTPWKASGAQLGHTVSVCERCMISNENNNREIQEQEENGSSDDIEEDSDSESDSDSNDDDGGDEDGGAGDNQVVPWSPTAPPPPPAASSSCSCTSNDDNDVDFVESVNVLSFKKQRLQDDLDRSCSLRMYANTATSAGIYSSSAGIYSSSAGGSLKEKRKELDPTV